MLVGLANGLAGRADGRRAVIIILSFISLNSIFEVHSPQLARMCFALTEPTFGKLAVGTLFDIFQL
jgi:hypothetical protein